MSIFDEDNSLEKMRKKLAALDNDNTRKSPPHKYPPEKRRIKLNTILKELEKGNNVQNRVLKTWLTDEEYEGFEQQWEGQKDARDYLKDKPSEITEYEKLLKKGIFSESRSTGYNGKINSKAAKQLSNSAQTEYETALEFLHAIITADPSLEPWFDRELDFSAKGSASLSGAGMPHVVTSQSLDNQGGGLLLGKMSKVEVKIDVVERAIVACLGV